MTQNLANVTYSVVNGHTEHAACSNVWKDTHRGIHRVDLVVASCCKSSPGAVCPTTGVGLITFMGIDCSPPLRSLCWPGSLA